MDENEKMKKIDELEKRIEKIEELLRNLLKAGASKTQITVVDLEDVKKIGESCWQMYDALVSAFDSWAFSHINVIETEEGRFLLLRVQVNCYGRTKQNMWRVWMMDQQCNLYFSTFIAPHGHGLGDRLIDDNIMKNKKKASWHGRAFRWLRDIHSKLVRRMAVVM